MKAYLLNLFVCLLIISYGFTSTAQDHKKIQRNTQHPSNDTTGKNPGKVATRMASGLASLFADSAKLTASDYQLRIEKNYVTLNRIDKESELGNDITDIHEKLTDMDAALDAIGENLNHNSKMLNLRNLQMYSSLLLHMHKDIEDQHTTLDSAERHLSLLRGDMKELIQDTVLGQLFRDSSLRIVYSRQLREMGREWRLSIRHFKESQDSVQQLQTHNSRDAVITSGLFEKTKYLLNTSRARILGKEYNYLWEPCPDSLSQNLRNELQRSYAEQRKALHYYFKDSGMKRLFLLAMGLLFFAWIYRNLYRLKKMNGLSKLKGLDIQYIYPTFILSSFIVMFSIGPLFDLDAPIVYVELMQLLLLITLTFFYWKKWPGVLFRYWIVMAILFVCFSFTHNILVPGLFQRCWLIFLNIASVVFGYLFLTRVHQHIRMRGFLRFVIILHNGMNIIAIICNIFGRFSLAQILGSTAIFAFTQVIGLTAFSKISMEAILLQIETSRLKQGVQASFDFSGVRKSFLRPVSLMVVLLWLIVFTANLNIYTTVLHQLAVFLNTPRAIGSAGFTLGGILLFFFIIWMAHLLQRYVGYFLGETGEEDELQNKEERSKMLIARLVVLCVGYLLAVSASGLPVDRITIVLGALGVGIGMGLQNIVSNFVSGVILIFDRPLRIGDSVEMGNVAGKVKEIGLRASTLLTQDGAEVVIPNGDILSQKITNWTLSNNLQRLEMELVVTGSKNRELVISSIKKAVLSSKYVFEKREPQVFVTGIRNDSFDLKVFFWCREVAQSDEAKSEILFLLYDQLASENISVK
jgi:small-conductance mechanosensitive channel